MKKTLLVTAIIMALSVKIFAQEEKQPGEFKPFKVDVSLGYAIPSGGSGSKGGVLFAVEPKYAVMQQLSLGLRIEVAVTVSGIDASGNINNNNASGKASGSYLATGDYYFSNTDFRPFIGAGLGIFTNASVDINSNNPNISEGSKFGEMIRAGFEYRHGRFGLEYNLAGKTTVPPSTSTSKDGYDIKNSYIGIKIGVCIGGGRR